MATDAPGRPGHARRVARNTAFFSFATGLSRLRPFSSSSVKTGTNAPWRAASANSARIRLGTWKAIVNADIAPLRPK